MFLTLTAIFGSAIWLTIIKPKVKDYIIYSELKDRDSKVLKKIYPSRGWWGYAYKVHQLPTLDFDKFVSMYKVNPEDWHLEQGIAYKDALSSYHQDAFDSGIFFTPFSNFRRYEKFRKNIEKSKNEYNEAKQKIQDSKTQEEILNKLLNSVKKDIEEVHEETLKNIEKVTKEAYEIKLRLEKGE